MTHDEYWNSSPDLVRIYRKAEELRMEKMNTQAWIQGIYFYEALCDSSPLFRAFGKGTVKAHPYSNKPHDLFGRNERKKLSKERKAEKANMEKGLAFMHKFMAAFNEAHQGGDNDADN